MKKVAIFCSSSYTIDPVYNEAAARLVDCLAEAGFAMVSGCTVKGTMGVISREAESRGMYHIGYIPRFMKGLEYPSASELHWTDTMSERKEKMREGTVAVVALPGGIGTLDELVETHCLRKLGKYSGKLFALNTNGFYNPYKALLDHYLSTEMMDGSSRALMSFPETPEELVEMLVKE
ncbi:MAG: TIGR00730 family Rossman fold protein [Bacteroidales bacterium]|nr:TIGR00730 family Rossman fold protein [Bacteroidales bacterium]